MLDEAIEVAENVIPDPEIRRRALTVTHRWLFDYFDGIIPLVTEAYQRERDAQFRGRERQRRQIVRRILAGEVIDESQLGYMLEQEHVAIVAWGANADTAITSAAGITGGSLLVTTGTEHAAWGWIGGISMHPPSVQSLIPVVPADTRLALGGRAHGTEGFRQTHRQALEAYRVGRLMQRQIVRFDDVELLALTTHDPQLAREFVERRLGALALPDDRAARLRDTLRVYFETGQNAAASGAALNVNDRTIAYRIRTIEKELGVPILGREDELSLAMRLLSDLGLIMG